MSTYLGSQRFEGPCRLCGKTMIRYWGHIQVHDECLEEMRNPKPRVTWWQRLWRRLR